LPERELHVHQTDGINSALYLPLLREGDCIGLLALGGKRPGIFGEREITLAESFRDQAQIAIENTRLFNETKEALERQTATADVLRVISRSTFDLDAVMHTLARSASELCDEDMGTLFPRDGDLLHLRGHSEIDETTAKFLA